CLHRLGYIENAPFQWFALEDRFTARQKTTFGVLRIFLLRQSVKTGTQMPAVGNLLKIQTVKLDQSVLFFCERSRIHGSSAITGFHPPGKEVPHSAGLISL